MPNSIDRRTFIKCAAAHAGLLAAAGQTLGQAGAGGASSLPEYRGPNVIIVRFGGGVRRRETIDPTQTYCPYFLHKLVPEGTFFPKMELSMSAKAVDGTPFKPVTSHGEGTLNIMTGRYDEYLPAGIRQPDKYERQIFDDRFEARVPTLFEYLRAAYAVPAHEAITINSEDRKAEEFYSFSNHHRYGIHYKCEVLSLFRFKCHLLRSKIEQGHYEGQKLADKKEQLRKMEALDFRNTEPNGQAPQIRAFWDRWAAFYGESGFVNPRGDRLLTKLTIRAMRELRPRLMMINYTDPDYVHWGNVNHYTRAIAIIDEELQRLYEAVQSDEHYRDNTVLAIVPDCGRDNARLAAVPCQHHFGDRTAHEIWGLLLGAGIRKGVVVDKAAEQIAVAPTLGRLMGVPTPEAEPLVLEEAIA
jgi:hypothetical protein